MTKLSSLSPADRDRVNGVDMFMAEIQQFRRLSSLALSDHEMAHRMASTTREVKKLRKLLHGGATKLSALTIDKRTLSLLELRRIRTVNDLLSKHDWELQLIPQFGPKRLAAVKEALCYFMEKNL